MLSAKVFHYPGVSLMSAFPRIYVLIPYRVATNPSFESAFTIVVPSSWQTSAPGFGIFASAHVFCARECTVLINPRRACAASVTVVGLCVCLSVDDYSRTTGYEAAYKRYQQLQCYKGMKSNVTILMKRLRSRDMA